MGFVRAFERQCGSQASVRRLRAHPAYHSFNNKWNLPVYFQIRSVIPSPPASPFLRENSNASQGCCGPVNRLFFAIIALSLKQNFKWKRTGNGMNVSMMACVTG